MAAILIEPVLGEGGYVAAPASYMRRLREICDKHGIMLIADEVQTGFGRTGRYFAIEDSGARPDIMVIAKVRLLIYCLLRGLKRSHNRVWPTASP